MNFYDRSGEPISVTRWRLLMEDLRYQVLQQDRVGPYFVSTVWLGIDHGFGRTEEPIIFETMVFKDDGPDIPDQRRYSTEEEALAGHAQTLNEVSLLSALDERPRCRP